MSEPILPGQNTGPRLVRSDMRWLDSGESGKASDTEGGA